MLITIRYESTVKDVGTRIRFSSLALGLFQPFLLA